MRTRRTARLTTIAVVAGIISLIVAATGSGRSAAAPVNNTQPTISGASVVGTNLTASRGTWSGTAPITYAYAWQRCDTDGKNCTPISGATNSTYTPTTSDLGKQLRVAVTASNNSGDVTATSDQTATISNANGKPANNVAPVISGTTTVGSTLTTTNGTWTGDTPITYSYQWQRCDTSGNACTDEPANGTASTYQLVKNDSGRTVIVEVNAKNSRGTGHAISNATAVVTDSTTGGGIIDMGNGQKSAPVESVIPGQRLIIKSVSFSPNPITSTNQTITARVTVTSTQGYYVRGAYVQIRSTPIVTESVSDQQTPTDGVVTFTIHPKSNFPIKAGYSVQFFVKAYQKGQDPLAGVSTSRLVQIATG